MLLAIILCLTVFTAAELVCLGIILCRFFPPEENGWLSNPIDLLWVTSSKKSDHVASWAHSTEHEAAEPEISLLCVQRRNLHKIR